MRLLPYRESGVAIIGAAGPACRLFWCKCGWWYTKDDREAGMTLRQLANTIPVEREVVLPGEFNPRPVDGNQRDIHTLKRGAFHLQQSHTCQLE